MPKIKSGKRFTQYGLLWNPEQFRDSVAVELAMIRAGGTIHGRGNGLAWHFRRAQELIWPSMAWHRWREQMLELWVQHKWIGMMGCAASGKTECSAVNALLDWYCFPDCTTTLVSSTDIPSLDLRIWGAIKRRHKEAKARVPWLPGQLIEGLRRLILDERNQAAEGRDFRNGLAAVPTKKGSSYVGISNWIGIHNKRVRLIADELQMMPRAFLDAASNLSKCEDFKLVGMGNPNDIANAHGALCEPSPELGGWDSNIDQAPGTKIWETRYPGGVCLQLPGSDSPNMDTPAGKPVPFPFLMTREQMAEDAGIWGTNDWHYAMMNDARMPRGMGDRRVLTRQMAVKFGAMLEPIWENTFRRKIAFLDAAYRGTGGDRCIFGVLEFGEGARISTIGSDSPLAYLPVGPQKGRMLLSLVDLTVIPIAGGPEADLPEDQIVGFVKNRCAPAGIPPEDFFFDAGMRTSLVTAFARLWSPNVESIDCGGSPTSDMVSRDIQIPCDKYYSKFITQLWYSVRLVVESGQFRNMRESALWEFCAREFKKVSGNRIEVESKADMKQKTGKSPDEADAVAVGVHGAIQRGFVIEKLGKDTPSERQSDAWKRRLQERIRKLWGKGQLQTA